MSRSSGERNPQTRNCRSATPFAKTLLAVSGAALLALAGCGNPDLHSVKGKVFFPDGSPLPEGRVVFLGVNGSPPASADGEIQKDGTFHLGSARPGDGVPLGKYKAAIVFPPAGEGKKRTYLIHPRFESLDTSGLEFEVKRGTNYFEIPVKGK